jgi:hypothetical protein
MGRWLHHRAEALRCAGEAPAGSGQSGPDTEHTEEGTSVRYLVCLSKDTETSPDAYRLCKRLTHPKKR